jgi:hypothetical protein
MKRSLEVESLTTKRLVLGVQRLSLHSAPKKRTPTPEACLMDVVPNIREYHSSGSEGEGSRHPSSDSEFELDNLRRRRSGSDPPSRPRGRNERTWSLPRIVQIKQEEKDILSCTLTTLYHTRSRHRMQRRASDPARARRMSDVSNLNQQDGYSGGCECDSDMEDQVYCNNCERELSNAF